MKKLQKKLLRKMRLTPDVVASRAELFLAGVPRGAFVSSYRLLGPAEPDEIGATRWRVTFAMLGSDGEPLRMDPNTVVVRVDDATGVISIL